MAFLKITRKQVLTFLVLLVSIVLKGQFINPGLVLTFDDYSIENWHKLIPILEKHHARATFFICCPYTFDSLDKQMILDLELAGNEIGSHGFYHYNSINYFDTAPAASYIKNEILPSTNWFESVLNINLNSFAYPYGAHTSQIDTELLKYFQIIRGTSYSLASPVNKITALSHSRIVSGVGIDDSYGHTLSSIKSSLSNCYADSIIQIFYSHKPVDSVTGNYQISYSKLDSILSYAEKIGLSFYTISETWLPIPPVPKGDTVIYDSTSHSLYSINQNNYNFSWKLNPSSSGLLHATDSSVSIKWDTAFYGDAALLVAYANNAGQGNYSQSLRISRKKISTITESAPISIKIYPNPSEGQITIKSSANFEKLLEIYNTSGQLVTKTTFSESEISLNIKTRGIYVARIVGRNKISTQTFAIE